MPTPAELREGSRLTSRAAEEESTPHLKRLLACHASALAQLAERIEREDATPGKARL
jgi:hypothetical protein